MKNYFVKYSNSFIVLGVILLGMYLFDIVPYRFRNAPDLIRWLTPALFIFIGFYCSLLDFGVEKIIPIQ